LGDGTIKSQNIPTKRHSPFPPNRYLNYTLISQKKP
jgi:hypothetical protein